MSEILIFDASLKREDTVTNYTIAFIHHQRVDFNSILTQLKIHFQEHIIPDHVILLSGAYLSDNLEAFCANSHDALRDIIPTRYQQDNMFTKFLSIYVFNASGTLRLLKGLQIEKCNLDDLFRIGMNAIFCKGGLISSEESHHFVFPSGKHCNKFLRTGNVLIKSQDIFFIAFNLLSRYGDHHEIIYCDTSSINSLAFALVELKRRMLPHFVCPHIESYGSYKGFEESEFVSSHKALFLISSSTSANIIDRLVERSIERNRIVLIYCLAPRRHKDLIICDLKKDEVNHDGIEPFETYAFNEPCRLCEKGSVPVPIQGDVFLLEKPAVNTIVFKTTDAPGLSAFMQHYHSKQDRGNLMIKTNFYENATGTSGSSRFAYEVFFDLQAVFEDLTSAGNKFPKFKEKLNSYIHQYIPSNTKYIIHLMDKGSELFARYLREVLSQVVKADMLPELVPMNRMKEVMNKEKEGAVLIVSSSMVSGGNLIYVSKELRDFPKLSIVYLVGFTRTTDEEYYEFIKQNLCQGGRGKDTNSYYSVETIHCNNEYKNTSWSIEADFILNLLGFCNEYFPDLFNQVKPFFTERLEILNQSSRVDVRGLSDELFYKNIFTNNMLKINKNFAFFHFGDYDQHVTQADIYFTLSTIINRLRYSKDLRRRLKQSEYVRNLIDPENFTRFNDGIIQACILRAAHPLELAYEIDRTISRKFLTIITPIVLRAKDHYGEAFLEFLYAIAIRKLRIDNDTLKELLDLIAAQKLDHPVIRLFCLYIQKGVLEKVQKVLTDYSVKYPMV